MGGCILIAAACVGAGASRDPNPSPPPSPYTDPDPSPAFSAVVDPNPSPPPSPYTDPDPSATLAGPKPKPSPVSPSPSALSEDACRRAALRPSTLRALDGAARTACFDGTTLTFDAELVGVEADIDWVPFQVPDRFRPVSAFGKSGARAPVYMIDPGQVDDPMTGLELRVSAPALAPTTLTGPFSARIEGHFDDPASTECRRPAGTTWPEITDETAVQMCRAQFIVARITPLG